MKPAKLAVPSKIPTSTRKAPVPTTTRTVTPARRPSISSTAISVPSTPRVLSSSKSLVSSLSTTKKPVSTVHSVSISSRVHSLHPSQHIVKSQQPSVPQRIIPSEAPIEVPGLDLSSQGNGTSIDVPEISHHSRQSSLSLNGLNDLPPLSRTSSSTDLSHDDSCRGTPNPLLHTVDSLVSNGSVRSTTSTSSRASSRPSITNLHFPSSSNAAVKHHQSTDIGTARKVPLHQRKTLQPPSTTKRPHSSMELRGSLDSSLLMNSISNTDLSPTPEPGVSRSRRPSVDVGARPPLDGSSEEAVRVIIRMRPSNYREIQAGAKTAISLDEVNERVLLNCGEDQTVFTFDHVAGPEETQERFFNLVGKPAVDTCIAGFNSTIFAYGQTGSGKTYTMFGPVLDVDGQHTTRSQGGVGHNVLELRGLMPRTLEYLFSIISQEEAKSGKIELSCSFLEIYNETLTDLLDPTSQQKIVLREDIKYGVRCDNLGVEFVSTVDEALALFRRGAANRRACATAMNHESSRSHTVFTLYLEMKISQRNVETVRKMHLNLIDLAGSERQTTGLSVRPTQLKESSNINRSLSALGNVIRALVEVSHGKPRHIHYRDSKLTFFLKDSLGGNAKTIVIANISPSVTCFKETLLTLHFARRMKQVRNKAVINDEVSTANVDALRAEVEALQRTLKLAEHELFFERVKNGNGTPDASQASNETNETWLEHRDQDNNILDMQLMLTQEGHSALVERKQDHSSRDLEKITVPASAYGKLLTEHRVLQDEFELLKDLQRMREDQMTDEDRLLTEAQAAMTELEKTLEASNKRAASHESAIEQMARLLSDCSCLQGRNRSLVASVLEKVELLKGSNTKTTVSTCTSPTEEDARHKLQLQIRNKLSQKLSDSSNAKTARSFGNEPIGRQRLMMSNRETVKKSGDVAAEVEMEGLNKQLEELRAELESFRLANRVLTREKAELKQVSESEISKLRHENMENAEILSALREQHNVLVEEYRLRAEEAAQYRRQQEQIVLRIRQDANQELADRQHLLDEARATIVQLGSHLQQQEEFLRRKSSLETAVEIAQREKEAAKAEVQARTREKVEMEQRLLMVLQDTAALEQERDEDMGDLHSRIDQQQMLLRQVQAEKEVMSGQYGKVLKDFWALREENNRLQSALERKTPLGGGATKANTQVGRRSFVATTTTTTTTKPSIPLNRTISF